MLSPEKAYIICMYVPRYEKYTLRCRECVKKKIYNPGFPIVWWSRGGVTGDWRWSSCASVCASLRCHHSPYSAPRQCVRVVIFPLQPPPTVPRDGSTPSSVICGGVFALRRRRAGGRGPGRRPGLVAGAGRRSQCANC